MSGRPLPSPPADAGRPRLVLASRATQAPITEAEAAGASEWGPVGSAVFGDLEAELMQTRRVVRAVPEGAGGWSLPGGGRTVDALLRHMASVLLWGERILSQSSVDLAEADGGVGPADAPTVERVAAVLAGCDRVWSAAQGVTDAALARPWSVRQGGHVIAVAARRDAFRRMCVGHLVHHRAQLGVALRAGGVAVPEAYAGL